MTVHVPTRCRREKRTEEISFKVSSNEKALIAAAAKSKNTKIGGPEGRTQIFQTACSESKS